MMLDKERHTEPVINKLFGNKEYSDEYIKRMIRGVYFQVRTPDTLVEAHKRLLGRQTYCWNGEFRYWVWDYRTHRIYVSNKKGIGIEVEPNFDADQTMEILRDYWSKFNV